MTRTTLDNLRMLAETGEVVGETRTALSQYSQLDQDRLKYKIPFPLAMDQVARSNGEVSPREDHGLYRRPDFRTLTRTPRRTGSR